MSQLNLLPWRELRRKEIDSQVRNIGIGVALLMAIAVYWGYLYMNGLINEQDQRNSYLEEQIKKVEAELKEVNKVKKKKADLISRMEVIQKLQSDRTRMVKLFDGLAKNLPKGMYLTLFEIKGNNITLQGSADSNGTISKFMRLIESAEIFTTPNLNVINIKNEKGLRVSNFTLKFNFVKARKKPKPDEKQVAASTQAKPGGAK
ncbi:MAG: type 4a pilus biogenesis protein PilN [Gammaproteobacteria bacterium]|nr:MAG: type 4a pilus biogenesis protein PilN [Gammaproteobacteria bacterium]